MKIVTLLTLITLSYQAMSQNGDDGFLLCYSKEEYGGKWPQYYQTGAGYEGGLYVLKKHFSNVNKNLGNQDDSGYLTIRFMINCVGEIGNFEVLQCDMDFKSKSFPDELKNYVITTLKGLTKWKVGIDGRGSKIDSQKFLTFIVNNGQIKDIVPK